MNYPIFKSNSEFEVQYINKKLKFKHIQKKNLNLELNIDDLHYYDFLPSSSKLFFVCNGKVIIYKISDTYDKIEKISEIKDYSNKITFASFNPIEENIMASISDNNVLKIWDIYDEKINSYKVLNNGTLAKWIQWEKGKLMYFYNNEIIIYDYNNDITYKLQGNLDNQGFFFFDNNHIIIISLESQKLEVKLFFLDKKEEKTIFEKEGINYFIYLDNFYSLVLFENENLNITTYIINNNYEIKENKLFQIKRHFNIIGYSASKLNNNEILLKLDVFNFILNTVNPFSFKIPLEKYKANSILNINKLNKKIKDFKELNLNEIDNKSKKIIKKNIII